MAALPPVGVLRFDAVPRDGGLLRPGLSAEPVVAAQPGMASPEIDHEADKTHETVIFLRQFPVKPVPLGVVAIGVVVAGLLTSHFVPHVEHRNALTDQ